MDSDSEPRRPGLPYRWELILLLWFAYFLNQADRQIYNNLLPLIEEDLGLSRVQLGLVASLFTLAYGLMVPVAGYAGDVLRRKWIVFGSLLFWSVATLATGFCGGVFSLILFRGLATGGGEAFYYPSANSLIGQFHHRTRAMAMAIHQTALYVGIVASFAAGYVGEALGWRSAFFLFGSAGVVMAGIVFFRMADTPIQASRSSSSVSRLPLGQVLREVAGRPTVLLLSVSFATQVFVNVGYLTWMPTFLHEQHGMSLPTAAFSALFFHHAFALVGVTVAGRLSDLWAARRRRARMECEYAGLLLGAPFIVLMGLAQSTTWCLVGLSLFGLFRGVYDSNLFAAPFDVIPPQLRSSAVGLMLSCAFIAGAAAPVLLGWLSEPLGMNAAIAWLGAAYVLGGLTALAATYVTFARDYYDETEEDPA